jgi:hypothetical protein
MFRKRFYILSILGILSFIPFNVFPQEMAKEKAIKFDGYSKLYGQFSNRQGENQLIPPSYLRWQVSSTLSVYGIPITGSFLLSNGQINFQQNVNFFSLKIDYERILQSKIFEKIPFLKTLRAFEIGTCRPTYSELIFNGIPLRGINLEWNPGLFYFGGSYGKALSPVIDSTMVSSQKFGQRILFLKTGIGQFDKTHFYISYLWGREVEGAVNPKPITYISAADTFQYQWGSNSEETYTSQGNSFQYLITPEENTVLGSEFQLNLFKNKLKIFSEVAGMLHTINSNDIDIEIEGWIFEWLKKAGVNISSHIDYAWSGMVDLKLDKTRLNFQSRMIGPGFYSMGVPYIRNDLMDYRVKLIQFFDRKRISANLNYRYSFDNLINQKQYRTTLSLANIGVNIRYPKVPFFQINLSQYNQFNDSELFPFDYQSLNFNASTGQSYKVNDLKLITTLNYSLLNNNRVYNDVTEIFFRNYFKINQSVRFKKPYEANVFVSVNLVNQGGSKSNYYSAGIKGMYRLNTRYNFSGGFRIVTKDWEETQTGFSLSAQTKIKYLGNISIDLEQNFVDYIVPERSFNEFIARFSLVTKW